MGKLDHFADGPSPLQQLVGNLDERDCKRVQWPSANGQPTEKQVGLWSLTQREGEEARQNAYKYVREVLKFSELDLAYDEQQAIADAKMCHLLASALRDPVKPINAIARDGVEIHDRLKPSQIRYLYQEYILYQVETDWSKDVEDPEKDLADLTELVKKNYPIEQRLTCFDTVALRKLVLSAVAQLAKSATEPSSDSSSPSDSAASPMGS